MSQTYTLTKTVTLSVSRTGTLTTVVVPTTGRTDYYYDFPAYAAYDTKYVDFSEIPANARIVDLSLKKSGDSASGSKSYFLQDADGQNIGDITSTAIKNHLATGARVFGLRHGFSASRKGPYTISQGATMTVTNTITYTVTVSYESAATIVNYGTKEGWAPCAVYYCDNGTYKPCRAYYGVNDEWKELG